MGRDQFEGRVPPYNKEAESAVLGAVLLNNDALEIVDAVLSKEDFYVESYRTIYGAMLELRGSGTPIDHVTLGQKLIRDGQLERVGGPMALDGLTDSVATVANVEHYAAIVYEQAAMRRVIYTSQTVLADAWNTRGTEEITAAVEAIVAASHGLARTRMPSKIFDLGPGVIDLYRKVAGGYRGIALPWPTLDNMTAGMWPKTLTMFVARPGVGKTFIAVIAARYAWASGYRTLIVSPEMSKEEIAERFFVVESGVSYRDMIHGQLSDFTLPKLEKTIQDLTTAENLWIMDASDDITPKGIEAAIRACKPNLVAVDSMYDLRVKGERRDRALVALEWMKDAAKRLEFACCGFAQQNRTAELSERKGGGARLGTIALADEIGQDAHAVFALEQSKDDKDDKVLWIKPLKLRRGQILKERVGLNWDFDAMKYDEIPEAEEGYKDEEEVPF